MKKSLFDDTLQIIIGAVFIFSAIIKFFPIETFEIEFIFKNGISWTYTPIITRLLISLELTLGFFIVVNAYKKIIFTICISLLISFSILLVYQLLTIGNQENCGCFGTLFPLNTIESLLKNILILISLFYLFNKQEWFSHLKIILILSYVVITTSIFLQYPVLDIRDFNELKKIKNNDVQFFSTLNNNHFTQGEHLIIFMSLKCSHCKNLSKKLSFLNKVNNLPPIHIFFMEDHTQNINDFFKITNSKFSYSTLSKRDFLFITKGKTPSIFHIKERKILHYWTSKNFNPDVFSKKK